MSTESWIKTKLGTVVSTSSGGTPSRSEPSYYSQGTIPWIRSGELEDNIITSSELKITKKGLLSSNAKILPAGTLLIAMYGATIGKMAFLGIAAATNQAVCSLAPQKGLLAHFLYYFLLYQRPNLIKKGIGGAQANISQTILRNLDITIPPLEIQERIVGKIEELFSEIDNAVSSLKTAKRKLEIYRSAVLKHAFSNSDKWEKLSLGELMKEVRNGCGTKPSDSGNYKILTIGSVRAMKVSIDEHRYNDKPFDEKDRIHENDLLFTRYNGSREFVGVCGVVPRLSESYAYPDKLIRFTPKINNSIHSKYIQFYVSQGKARRYIRSKIKTSSGQNGIAGSDLKKTEIHLPSLQEQKRIVENIELKFGLYEDIDCTISCALRRAESLKQSILKRAFERGLT